MTALLLSQTERMLPELLMAAGVVMLIVFVVLNIRRRAASRGGARLSPHEKLERIKQTHGMRGDLRDMMVELEDLTRRFSAQLDAKTVRLEKLLSEADARIEELRRLRGGGGMDGGSAAGPTQERSEANSSLQDEPDPLTRDIYQRADAGQTPVQIAGELNEHVGKIELILALRQQ